MEEYELIIKETRKLIEVIKPHTVVSEVLITFEGNVLYFLSFCKVLI